jgi:hypothetical protein
MAQRKEAGRGNMSIFQALPTLRWAILVKPLRGVQMASISVKSALEKATSLPGGRLRPSCLPFGRLDGAGYEFAA